MPGSLETAIWGRGCEGSHIREFSRIGEGVSAPGPVAPRAPIPGLSRTSRGVCGKPCVWSRCFCRLPGSCPEILMVHLHSSPQPPSGAWSPGSDWCPRAGRGLPFSLCAHLPSAPAIPVAPPSFPSPAPGLCLPCAHLQCPPCPACPDCRPSSGLQFPSLLGAYPSVGQRCGRSPVLRVTEARSRPSPSADLLCGLE